MQVLSHLQSLTVRPFALEEVQPSDGLAFTAMTQLVQERYGFQAQGISLEAQQRGMIAPAYERGEFLVGERKQSIFGLDITPDGLKVSANRTETGDALIDDLLEFARDVGGFNTERITRSSLYSSTMIVEADERELTVLNGLSHSANLLAKAFERQAKHRTVKPFGIKLAVAGGNGDAYFMFEKRLGPQTGSDVYFSQAPLPSAAHEQFLQELLTPATA